MCGIVLSYRAARGGHSCVCANLLKHKISPNVQDHHGRTPLQCAAYGGFINCMNILLEEGADPDLQDEEVRVLNLLQVIYCKYYCSL